MWLVQGELWRWGVGCRDCEDGVCVGVEKDRGGVWCRGRKAESLDSAVMAGIIIIVCVFVS